MRATLFWSFVFLFELALTGEKALAQVEEESPLCTKTAFECTEELLKRVSQLRYRQDIQIESLRQSQATSLETLKASQTKALERTKRGKKEELLALSDKQRQERDRGEQEYERNRTDLEEGFQLREGEETKIFSEQKLEQEVVELTELLRFRRQSSHQLSQRVFLKKRKEPLSFVSFLSFHFQAVSVGKRILHVFDWTWDLELFSFSHDEDIQALSFSQNGDRALTGSGRLARVFDLKQGLEMARLPLLTHPISAVASSQEGEKIAIGSASTLYIFELLENLSFEKETPSEELSSEEIRGGTTSSSSTNFLFQAREKDRFNSSSMSRISDIAFLPGGKKVMMVTDGGEGYLFDLENGIEIQRFSHEEAILELKISKNGLRALTRSKSEVRLLDLEEGLELKSFSEDSPFLATSFSLDEQKLALGSAESKVRIFDFESESESSFSRLSPVTSLSFSPQGDRILIVDQSSFARIFDLETKQLLHRLPHRGRVKFASFSPEGRLVITADSQQNISVFELERLCVISQ